MKTELARRSRDPYRPTSWQLRIASPISTQSHSGVLMRAMLPRNFETSSSALALKLHHPPRARSEQDVGAPLRENTAIAWLTAHLRNRFEKSLYDLIKGLRNHKGGEDEYVQHSLRECKAEIKSQDMGKLPAYQLPRHRPQYAESGQIKRPRLF